MRDDQCGSGQRWQAFLPEFAPLPGAFVNLLFDHSERFNFAAFPSDPEAPLFDRIWAETQIMRGHVFGHVHSVVLAERSGALDDRLSISWFQKALKGFDPLHKEAKDSLDSLRSKVSNWQMRRLLRTQEFGVPEPNSASAVLMMRALSSWRRAWMPSEMGADEPWFWVWGQEPGKPEPQMYALPLPAETPPNTLLWTSWPGAAWLPGWQIISPYGALAWAKTVQFRGHTLWDLSMEELAAWDQPFVEGLQLERHIHISLPGLQAAYGLNDEPYQLARRHAIADALLFKRGEPLLFTSLQQYYAKRVPLSTPALPEQPVLDLQLHQ